MIRHRDDFPQPPRRGFVLLEAVVATTLLLFALTAFIGFLSLLNRQKSQVDRREQAALLAANLMERLAANPAALALGDTPLLLTDNQKTRFPHGLSAWVSVRSEPLEPRDADEPGPTWLHVQLHLQWPGSAQTYESFHLGTWVAPAIADDSERSRP